MSVLRQFVKHYNAYLLKIASINDIPGALFQQVLLSKRLKTLRENVVIRLGLPDDERQALRARLAATPKVPAYFADIDLTQDVHANGGIDLPNVLEALKGEIKVKKVSSFRFKGVVEQRLTDALQLELERLIDEVEDNDPASYKHHLKRYEMATALYYANEVVIKFESGVDISAEAKAEVASVNGKVSVGVDNKVEIRYNQVNCPFAVGIVRIKDIDYAEIRESLRELS